MKRLFDFKNLTEKTILQRFYGLGVYVIMGMVVVSVTTIVLWQLRSIFSPTTNSSVGSTTIVLRSSDHSLSGSVKTPLIDSLTDNSQTPSYDNISTPTPISQVNGKISLPRLQGEVEYR